MTSVVVDSRLRQRRIDVDREAGRRRLRRMGGLAVVVVLFAVVVGVAFSPLLDVDRIEVSGATRTSVGAVLVAGGLELGEPLVRFDPDRVAAGVAELPWIEAVTVQRRWNGVVSVRVVEREPAGAVARGDEIVLVDASGQVLSVGGRDPVGITIVEAAVGDVAPGGRVDPALVPLLVIAGRAPGATGIGPGSVRFDDGDVVWVVDDVGRFRFGSVDDLDAKLIALATVLEALGGTVGGELDLRIPSTVIRHADAPAVVVDPGPGAASAGGDDTAP